MKKIILVQIIVNIFLIVWLMLIVKKESLIKFYIIVYITVIISVLFHELGHIICAKKKKYMVCCVNICGLKINFLNKKIKIDIRSLCCQGQTYINFEDKIIDSRTLDQVLLDVKINFLWGPFFTLLLLLFSILMLITQGVDVVYLCFIWININMLLTSFHKNHNSIQDLYGFYNFEYVRKDIICILFFQTTSANKKNEFLENCVMVELLGKLKEKNRLTKNDLSALIQIIARKEQYRSDAEIIFHYIFNDYKQFKYDNMVLYFLLLSTIVIRFWSEYEIKELYDHILRNKEYMDVIQIPLIGYRYIHSVMQSMVNNSEIREFWKNWDEIRLGLSF